MYINLNIIQPNNNIFTINNNKNSEKIDLYLWHQRLAHINIKPLLKLIKNTCCTKKCFVVFALILF